jgi:hypothetical protein
VGKTKNRDASHYWSLRAGISAQALWASNYVPVNPENTKYQNAMLIAGGGEAANIFTTLCAPWAGKSEIPGFFESSSFRHNHKFKP